MKKRKSKKVYKLGVNDDISALQLGYKYQVKNVKNKGSAICVCKTLASATRIKKSLNENPEEWTD